MGYIGEGINQTATSVETAKDEFFGTYYGQISSDPSVDPNGEAITDGDLFYNTSEEALKIRVNGEWLSLRTATTGYQQFTATSGQTTFNVAGSFSPGFVFVTLNGVVLSSGDYDDSSGTEIVLTSGAADGDIVGVYIFDTFSVSDTVSASAGGTFSSPIAFPDGSESSPSITNDQDTDTGIYFPADNTIAFTEGGTEAARIDSSGNLLVGKTSTNASATGTRMDPNGRLLATMDNNNPLFLNRLNGDGVIADFRKDTNRVGSIGTLAGRLGIGTGSAGIYINDDANSIQGYNTETNTNTDDALDIGSFNKRFKDLYLSGGVYLGGTGSANYLDDYEQGSFTPTFEDESGNQASVGFPDGVYTKIGNQVFVSVCFFNIDTTGLNGSEYISIKSLPFAVNLNFFGARTPMSVEVDNFTFTGYLTANARESNNSLRITRCESGSGDLPLSVNSVANTSADVVICGHYRTSD